MIGIFNGIRADIIIYIYLSVCFTFMMFNYAYINRANREKRDKRYKNKQWIKRISQQFNRVAALGGIHPRHLRYLLKELAKIETLIDYSKALNILKREHPEAATGYIRAGYDLFQKLAKTYRRKDDMERAYYADFISRFLAGVQANNKRLLETLLSYLDSPDIYCRENTMRALYALGSPHVVENALQIINDKGWFHHHKLISDGLAAFTGDKEALASVLWGKYRVWDDYLMLAIVRFITSFSPNYREAFLPVLEDSSANLDIRLAIIRYYRRYAYAPAQAALIRYVYPAGGLDENLAIVAASALERYPGKETAEALIHSLSSPNWHVRYNAASALVAMNLSEAKLWEILQDVDEYARDMLWYKMEQNGYTFTVDDIEKPA